MTFVNCPKCGKAAHLGPMIEMMEIGVPDPTVFGAVRRFSATCPSCGPFFHDKPGHHGTITEKQMSQRFPKETRKVLRNVLSQDERKRFNDALRGKREPNEEDIQRWLALSESMNFS
jgi:hypothetical protein